MNALMARVVWQSDTVIRVMKAFVDEDMHSKYCIAKKNNKMDEFYDGVGRMSEVPGSKIRDLIKNLGKKFRTKIQRQSLSGSATEELTLKGSSEIYNLYNKYQETYFPKGSAVCPKEVVSEDGVLPNLLNESATAEPLSKREKLTTNFKGKCM